MLFLYAVAVSQFTLYGFLKGNKPDFHVAMLLEKAKPFYAYVVDMFKISYNPDAIKGAFAYLFSNFMLLLILSLRDGCGCSFRCGDCRIFGFFFLLQH